MIIALIAVIYIFILGCEVKKEKNIYNPCTLFAGIWLIVMILSGMQLYNLSEVSDRAYIIAMLGVLSFAIGCAARNRIVLKFGSRETYSSGVVTQNYDLRYGFLIGFYALILIFTAMLASRSIALIMSGVSMSTIRFNYRNIESGIVIGSNMAYQFEGYVVTTAEFGAIALFPIVLTDKKTFKNIILLVELAAFLVLHLFVTGARSFLIDVAILLAIYMLINSGMRKKFREYFNKIPKFIIVLIGAGAIALVVFVTSMRKADKPILAEIYNYLAISFPLFDVHLGITDTTQEFTYGLTAFNALLRPVFLALRIIHIPFPSAYLRAMELLEENNLYYNVGLGRANSFVSVFYNLYIDFGVISVILGCILYGYIAQCVYKKMKRDPNRRNQALYLLIAIGLVLSFVRLFFTAHRYLFAFALIILAFKKTQNDTLRIHTDG